MFVTKEQTTCKGATEWSVTLLTECAMSIPENPLSFNKHKLILKFVKQRKNARKYGRGRLWCAAAMGYLLTLSACSNSNSVTSSTTSTVTSSQKKTSSTSATLSAPMPSEPTITTEQSSVSESEIPAVSTSAVEPYTEVQTAQPEVPAYSGPSIGDSCIGANIGMRAVDANGNSIMCDNYAWVLDQGQVPSHPWADDQRAWTECIESQTEEVCRQQLNG